jgi:Restriction endonuclease
MGSINDVIEAFRRASTNVDRGTPFEKLMVRYFQLDPALTQQYSEVWRWIDWPDRRGKTDTGIDLVARERDTGEYTAIQCKLACDEGLEQDPEPSEGGFRRVLFPSPFAKSCDETVLGSPLTPLRPSKQVITGERTSEGGIFGILQLGARNAVGATHRTAFLCFGVGQRRRP